MQSKKPTARKKPGPKPKIAAPTPDTAARGKVGRPATRAPKKSERMQRSLLPGVTPEILAPIQGVNPQTTSGKKPLTFKQIEVSPEQVASFSFEVSLDPTLFQKVRKASGRIPIPVSFDPKLYAAFLRYNPRKGALSTFCNQAVTLWLKDNLDQVLLASLEAVSHKHGAPRNVMISIDPDIAIKLKAATVLLKDKGFAKATISSLILGCTLLQAKDLKLV